jgi:tRNA nucleotidyltransferase/poly(A) polymerase
MKAARACTHLIKEANSRRLMEELYKILRCGASAGSVINLKDYGLMQHWIPELAAVRDHGNLVSRLRVVDRRHGEGETISTGVLIAALMYDLFEESLYKNNEQPKVQESFETLMRDFKDLASRISISRREWDHMCGITARQGVFTPIGQGSRWGHFEKKFVHNEYFKDAFLLFQIIAEASGRNAKEVEYWNQRLSSAPQERKEPQEKRQGAPAAHRRRRPRHPRGPRVT